MSRFRSFLVRHPIGLGFALACTIISWTGMAAYWGTHRMVRSFDSVTQSQRALEKLLCIQGLMESAESSVYGYVITGTPAFLQPYRDAEQLVPDLLADMKGLLEDGSIQTKTLLKLERMTLGHLSYLRHVVSVRRTKGYDAAKPWVAAEESGSPRMLTQQLLAQLQLVEGANVRRGIKYTWRRSSNVKVGLVAVSVLSLIFLLWAFAIWSRESRERRRADIDRIRALELTRDSAIQSARLKAEFIRNMGHEFRTPLSVIMGMSNLLWDTVLNADQRRFTGSVRKAAENLSRLAKDMLDFARIEKGSFEFEMMEVPVAQIVDRVLHMFNEQVIAKGITVSSEMASDVPAIVLGDTARLQQVLTQLVSNAIKFTVEGSIKVYVSIVPGKGTAARRLLWRVTDTGIGVDTEAEQSLFQTFRQGDGSATRRFGGTGLGLAIASRIVELMGGEIGFNKEKAGTTFWFSIPLREPGDALQGPEVSRKTGPQVLVLDEDDTVRELYRQQLSLCGLSCETFSHGEAAIALLRRERAAGRGLPIVVTNMHLSDMEGIAFVQEVRREPDLRATQILVMSPAESPIGDEMAASLGFAGWVPKPPQAEALYTKLSDFLIKSSTKISERPTG